MRWIVICNKGCEDVCSKEIKELINVSSDRGERVVSFETDNLKKIVKFCYMSHSAIKVLYLLDDFKFKSLDDILKKAKKINLKGWINKDVRFRVSAKRYGKHDFGSEEICKQVGETVFEKYKLKVDLENPGLVVFVYVLDDKCYLGIDVVGFDMSKRYYKVFHHPFALKGTVAYATVRFSGFKEGILADPFAGSGTIPIEASLFVSGFPVNYNKKEDFAFINHRPFSKLDFDKIFDSIDKKVNLKKIKVFALDTQLPYVTAAKKNAKIAGIKKGIKISKMDVEWLDTKFRKESVDNIVAQIPVISKHKNEKQIKKLYNELFHQAAFVLIKKGNVTLIARKTDFLEEAALKNGFKLAETKEIYSGEVKYFVVIFKKVL